MLITFLPTTNSLFNIIIATRLKTTHIRHCWKDLCEYNDCPHVHHHRKIDKGKRSVVIKARSDSTQHIYRKKLLKHSGAQ